MGFFESILNFFSAIWNFISNLVSGIGALVPVVIKSVEFPILVTGYVPTFLSACVIAVVSVGIVKLILGWGNS